MSAAVAAALEARDVMPGGIMVAGAERRRRYRHPVVTDAPLDSELLVVAVGIRGGLNVALTRCAALGAVDLEWSARHAVACRVESAMMAASRPGNTWGDALTAGLGAYGEAGWSDEWREHTQGGPIGYGPREFVVYPGDTNDRLSGLAVGASQACAWNPTVAGAKSEDTFLVTEQGPESVTSGGGSWPVVDLGAMGAPARPAVLEL